MSASHSWLDILRLFLDNHFPEYPVYDTETCRESLRVRFHRFVRDVDEHVYKYGTSLDIFEWTVTRMILNTITKKTNKAMRYSYVNCLNTYGPHIDKFIWLVYAKSPNVWEGVKIWCHCLGWERVYSCLNGLSVSLFASESASSQEGCLNLIGFPHFEKRDLTSTIGVFAHAMQSDANSI